MSKKDYELLAKALKDSKPALSPNLRDLLIVTWRISVNNITQALAQDNPRFNRAKFLKACDYE